MSAFIAVLAEVGDKVPRLPILFLWSAVIVLLAWVMIRKKKWLAFVPLILAIFFAVGATQEPRDVFVGPAIIQELGYSYVVSCYLAAALPFLAITVLIIRKNENNGA